MITFEKIRWKNFLSTGNSFTEIEFNRSPSTLVVGENGSGKSTMLDAVCFALFNKPFRKISKTQLINSINNKKLVVEIEFRIGGKQYKVIRGVKPNIFEIYLNDNMIDQDAAVRDTQKYLEESILKMNFKSFTQIVILGSASFTPFMQLPTASRREIIEDILDIEIFTTMNGVLRDHIAVLRDEIRDVETEVEVAKQKATVQRKYIEQLEKDKKIKVDKIKEKIDELIEATTDLETKLSEASAEKESHDDPKERKRKLDGIKDKLESNLRKARKELNFYHDTDECPTCKQGLTHDFKEEKQKEKSERIQQLETGLLDMDMEYSAVHDAIEKYDEIVTNITELQSEIISQERYKNRLTLELNEAETNVADIDEEKNKLKTLAKDVVDKNVIKTNKGEEQHYNTAAASLLKDTGIKTRVIRQYLPIINQLVNKYLAAMDFFVHFDLDEKFNETIKSRHRDRFSYSSFSEGEKQRIDLALLFTWRTIAKMKNSASTNLLLLDEVFDSSLDNNGVDYVMNLLSTIGEETNVFVISHKGDQLFDKFRNQIKFEKIRNYSVMS
jgi:DNA repair exonuclease SbcCD ATPase subunit|tara:strand:+ start:1556 stop:3226 length:1671 start_codon:yes stop_codon:yes gene_type:complete